MWLWDYHVSSRKWQTGWLFSRISVDTKVLALFFSSLWHLLVQLWFYPLDHRVLVSTEVFFPQFFCIPTYHPVIKWLSGVMCLWCLLRRNHIADHPTLCRLECRAVVRATNKAIICIENMLIHVNGVNKARLEHTDFLVFIIFEDIAKILFSWTVTLTYICTLKSNDFSLLVPTKLSDPTSWVGSQFRANIKNQNHTYTH